jgi:hypothetical protein
VARLPLDKDGIGSDSNTSGQTRYREQNKNGHEEHDTTGSLWG